jgi:cytoskeletal protein RodZ
MVSNKGERHFGHFLQQCRREKEIPLEVVSRLTRISGTTLRQIEGEELDNLPAPLYVKSFLKAYAQALGIDPQEVLRRYENALEQHGPIQTPSLPATDEKRIGPRLILAAALFAAVVGVTVYLAERGTRKPNLTPTTSAQHEDEQKQSAPPADAVQEPQETAHDAPREASPPQTKATVERQAVPGGEQPSEKQAEVNGQTGTPVDPKTRDSNQQTLVLEMSAVESTWVKAIADGMAPREFSLKPDDRVTLEAREKFNLLIGNAGGIRLHLNGRQIQVPGKSGQVVTIQLP